MASRVLFVDDEPNVLDGLRRLLARRIKIETAVGGEAALALLRQSPDFAVIVTDMRMPGMNGIELIAAARQRCPDAVYLMLTGNADQGTAVDAVNRGQVFRFLNKPVQQDVLEAAIAGALRQHQLVTAERSLLEETLQGTVRLLGQLVSLSFPDISERCERLRKIVRHAAGAMRLADPWQVEVAALLFEIGHVVLPPAVAAKLAAGTPLTAPEVQVVQSARGAACRLLEQVPRLKPVAEIIAGARAGVGDKPACNAGGDAPGDSKADAESGAAAPPFGSVVLRAAVELDKQLSNGLNLTTALENLRRSGIDWSEPLLGALGTFEPLDYGRSGLYVPAAMKLIDLAVGMITDQEIRNGNGVLQLATGIELTVPLLERLRAQHRMSPLPEPIRVLCAPADAPKPKREPVASPPRGANVAGATAAHSMRAAQPEAETAEAAVPAGDGLGTRASPSSP